jgi:integrase/recombinase XerD
VKSNSDNVRGSPGGRRSSSKESKSEKLPESLDLLSPFLSDLRLRRMSPGSIESMGCRIRVYLRWCSARALDPLSAGREDLLAYLEYSQSLKHSSSTLKKDFSALVSFYELLEEQGKSSSANQVKNIQKKYMRSYKPDAEERQIISIEQAASMVATTIDTRDKAILLLLLKTGIRRGELVSLDRADVSLDTMAITLKPTAKRSNRIVFFDQEAKEALERWLRARARRAGSEPALFLGESGKRLLKKGVRNAVVRAAERVGLHTQGAPLDARFGPHCCRHWWTTHLLRSGCPREYVQFLRGDAIKEAVDIYYHLDIEDVRKSYLAHVPQLGV